jgi:hypothetical protein
MWYSKRVILALTLLLVPLSADAFDGQRKGFVIGGGTGYSPVVHWSMDDPDVSESTTGFLYDFVIGYAWDNRNLLVYEAAPTFFESDYWNGRDGVQGVWDVKWYHYFGRRGSSIFSTVGVGRAMHGICNTWVGARGLGFYLGSGYEFVPHIQAGVFLAIGSGSDDGYDFSHETVSIVLTGLAY